MHQRASYDPVLFMAEDWTPGLLDHFKLAIRRGEGWSFAWDRVSSVWSVTPLAARIALGTGGVAGAAVLVLRAQYSIDMDWLNRSHVDTIMDEVDHWIGEITPEREEDSKTFGEDGARLGFYIRALRMGFGWVTWWTARLWGVHWSRLPLVLAALAISAPIATFFSLSPPAWVGAAATLAYLAYNPSLQDDSILPATQVELSFHSSWIGTGGPCHMVEGVCVVEDVMNPLEWGLPPWVPVVTLNSLQLWASGLLLPNVDNKNASLTTHIPVSTRKPDASRIALLREINSEERGINYGLMGHQRNDAGEHDMGERIVWRLQHRLAMQSLQGNHAVLLLPRTLAEAKSPDKTSLWPWYKSRREVKHEWSMWLPPPLRWLLTKADKGARAPEIAPIELRRFIIDEEPRNTAGFFHSRVFVRSDVGRALDSNVYAKRHWWRAAPLGIYVEQAPPDDILLRDLWHAMAILYGFVIVWADDPLSKTLVAEWTNNGTEKEKSYIYSTKRYAVETVDRPESGPAGRFNHFVWLDAGRSAKVRLFNPVTTTMQPPASQ